MFDTAFKTIKLNVLFCPGSELRYQAGRGGGRGPRTDRDKPTKPAAAENGDGDSSKAKR